MWEFILGKNPLWQEQARAAGGEELVNTIEGLARAQGSMAKSQATMSEVQKTMGEDIHEIKASLASLITTAFPAGDAEGHRRYHDLMIRRTEEIRRLRMAIQEKTISGLIWALIAFLGWCVLTAIASKMGFKP